MTRVVVCATSPASGVRHRFIVLRQVKAFADHFGYTVHFLWGVSKGVSFCRYEELFLPVPGVAVQNVAADVFAWLGKRAEAGEDIGYQGHRLQVVPPLKTLPVEGDGSLFCWDMHGCPLLAALMPRRSLPLLVAEPAAKVKAWTDAYIRANGVPERLGIRVRVTELLSQSRKPHRVQAELDEVLRSLYRIPWYVRVFIATDSEYLQQMLAAHFVDARFLPKRFDLEHATGRYVHRQDKEAMYTFLHEVGCLCACRRVINLGGFLNDGLIKPRILEHPYEEAALMHLRRA